jgi:hypothetical protein
MLDSERMGATRTCAERCGKRPHLLRSRARRVLQYSLGTGLSILLTNLEIAEHGRPLRCLME